MTDVMAGRSAWVAGRGYGPGPACVRARSRWSCRSAGVIAGGREIVVAGRVLMVVGAGARAARASLARVVRVLVIGVPVIGVLVIGLEVVEGQHVHVVDPLDSVGLARGVGRSRPPEPVPSLVFAARVDQRVGVRVKQPGRTGPAVPVGELGDLQRD